MTFRDDGSVELAGGCDRAAGRFEVTGDTLTLSINEFAYDASPCEAEDVRHRGIFEAIVKMAFSGPIHYSIEESRLDLTQGNLVIQLYGP